MQPFQPMQVFLDTEVFDGEGFHFESLKLQLISSLASAGKIKLMITDVTRRECCNRIKKHLTAAKTWLKNPDLRKPASVLARTSFGNAHRGEVDVKALSAELEQQSNAYLTKAGAQVCETADISVKELMDSYFDCRPPFGDAQKKDQFPDAVVALALAKAAAKTQSPIYVVTEDTDFTTAHWCHDRQFLPRAGMNEIPMSLDRYLSKNG